MGRRHTFKVKTLTDRKAFENYLRQTPTPNIKAFVSFLNSLETNEFVSLLSSHKLRKNIYKCDDIEELLLVYEELKQNTMQLAQDANHYGNKAARTALAWLIKHLLEINNGNLN